MIADNAVIEGRPLRVRARTLGGASVGARRTLEGSPAEARAAAVPAAVRRSGAAAGPEHGESQAGGGLRRLWSKLVR